MSTSRVRAVQERRRSNAAGPHGAAPTRATQLAAALGDQLDVHTEEEAADAYSLMANAQCAEEAEQIWDFYGGGR